MGEKLRVPFREIVKSIPGFFGIRLEAEPKYEVVARRGEVEIRRYLPATVAEVTIAGPHDDAVDEGFRRLAAYIFGKNVSSDELAMTVPVYQRHERLPMTTPVTQKGQAGAWTLAFFLGNVMRVDDAPKPIDPSITLRTEPERLVASLRYSGTNNDDRRSAARRKLLDALLTDREFDVAEDVYWAQYDAPFVLPFVKRNEAQVEIVRRPRADLTRTAGNAPSA